MEYDIESLRLKLKKIIPHDRFIHSEGVEKEAVMLAKQYGADEKKAQIAGLLHDITKFLSADEQLKLCDEFGIILSIVEKHEPKLLHAMTGAQVAKREFMIDDTEIIDAIRYHTTARPNMTILEKVLYLADFTEPGRKFEGVDQIRELVYKDINEGLIFALDFTIKEIINKKSLLHPDTIAARNYYLFEEAGY